MDALRFVPFSSAPKVAFWQAVAERKLRDWRLDDAPRPWRGAFTWPAAARAFVLDAALPRRRGAARRGGLGGPRDGRQHVCVCVCVCVTRLRCSGAPATRSPPRSTMAAGGGRVRVRLAPLRGRRFR